MAFISKERTIQANPDEVCHHANALQPERGLGAAVLAYGYISQTLRIELLPG